MRGVKLKGTVNIEVVNDKIKQKGEIIPSTQSQEFRRGILESAYKEILNAFGLEDSESGVLTDDIDKEEVHITYNDLQEIVTIVGDIAIQKTRKECEDNAYKKAKGEYEKLRNTGDKLMTLEIEDARHQAISEVREWLMVTGGYEFAVVLKEFDNKFGGVK